MTTFSSAAAPRSSERETADIRPLGSVPPRRRAADDAYETLRDAILSHRLQPGANLSVPSLADQLGLSRSPVREAVQRLVQQGLATEEVHRGAIVARLDSTSILRLYELREGLEGMAARLACERATQLQLDEIAATFEEHEFALSHEDYRRHVELDQRFHAGIRHAAQNEHLESALERVQDMVAIAMLSADITWPKFALAEHQEILDALQSRSPEQSEAAARQHIGRLRKDLADLFDAPLGRQVVVDRIEAQQP